MNRTQREAHLVLLADRLVTGLVQSSLGIREGIVMSLAGVQPYRRLDCDGKALCYVRCRPLKRAVRVDISGLWRRSGRSPLEVPGSSGSLTLMLATAADVEEAVSYLRSIVAATRQA
jgi:hypothetical protein